MRFQGLLYFSLILCGNVSCKIIRIIGGQNADIKNFPHIVSLRYYSDNKHFCGGSIISKWHILTAAHCLYTIQSEYHDVKIYTGTSSSRSTNGQSFDIANVIIHPQFTGIKSEEAMDHYDIAIIKLTKCIYFNEYQKRIDLPTTNIFDKVNATLAGWGYTTFPADYTPDQLQQSPMIIYQNSDCSRYVPFDLKREQFCAFYKRGIGACIGDSGSPLSSNGKIVGIISFTVPCALGYPDIYTNVYSFVNFIKYVLRVHLL